MSDKMSDPAPTQTAALAAPRVQLDDLAALRVWFRSVPGLVIAEAEQALAREILPNLFGYHAVQIGTPHASELLEHSRISHRLVIGTELIESRFGRVIADPVALPIERNSVDVVVLPHTLEFSPNAHGILREAERILIGEGHVVILGFNPWSSFGCSRHVLGWRGRAPWSGSFLSLARLKDWLGLLGFEIERVARASFRPPISQPSWHARLEFLERMGAHFWPLLGNVYALVARKRVEAIMPIRARWARRRRLAARGVIEPTARTISKRD